MAPIALLSVSDKSGLIPLAKSLINDFSYEIISSGGTAKCLEEEGLSVTKVADYTGAPEILGGRVKTLHPKIHGGILARRNDDSHKSDLETQNIELIDLVVVNLYPFAETIEKPNISWEEAIENIDIGGPTLIRAAAKNHDDVAILTSPKQYQNFLENLSQGKVDRKVRKALALEAFQHTAKYDLLISNWFAEKTNAEKSSWLQELPVKQRLRYGENPHQNAIWYSEANEGWGGAIQLQGKELSTNNLLDLEAALATVCEFGYGNNPLKPCEDNAAVVIKHTNPCGVAVDSSPEKALKKALDADRVSAFGGIIALNSSVNAVMANEIKSLFIECVVAPNYEKEAREMLAMKANLRVLELSPALIKNRPINHIRSILGGLLVQDLDNSSLNKRDWSLATKISPTEDEFKDLSFAWKIVRHVRSNAIVVASQGQSIGIGAGQMNRIGSAKIALEAASKKAKGAVLASDGFFPFDDTVSLAGEYGIKAIIQPGGSIRDKDSIAKCDELGIKMILTGRRHFLH